MRATNRTEYRAGWIDVYDVWHPFTAGGAFATAEEAEADLKELLPRYRSGHVAQPIRQAVKAGRFEVRSRTVTVTPWLPV